MMLPKNKLRNLFWLQIFYSAHGGLGRKKTLRKTNIAPSSSLPSLLQACHSDFARQMVAALALLDAPRDTPAAR
jgi:hypothetical protein